MTDCNESITANNGENEDEDENNCSDKKCIFCKIVKREMDTELLHQDEDTTCFRDIKPGAPHHYLVVPTKHVGNCKTLNKEHIPLVEKLVETGKAILQKNNVTDLSDVRFGFHWPPFQSVQHLHLHVLAPASQMGFMSRFIYRLDSYWFITNDCDKQYHGIVSIEALLYEMKWKPSELALHYVERSDDLGVAYKAEESSAEQLLQRLYSTEV